ncbi:MAG: aerotaxis receptor Aer [Sulfurimonas sp. RIFOXYD12_FULL_33_39]|nr:MAG: aerotaxis receptor Aer [Sulfurimonas sp. RIFCSPLOWO2_12_FULL_34_6]OHE08809.1 MAG: aerotaxis receptor Aer [Sulfurimonas sp. RIFOXYD12_FULL_33_39]OHE14094.1 MAG: aerotaxis receptor Aer [Sulfurimonas sp. RIFOXYD2_FULL_34_21]DAB28462.1 MAG TPA: aerotaxis receptor Aer [Sulfurimonas sp. UBA10385]
MSNNELSILNQYHDIVDATNIVSKTDLKGIITYVNSKFIEISGYTEEELIGKPHNIVRDPKLPSTIFKELWRTIQSKNVWKGVVTNLRKDGTSYTVDASIFPILNSEGEIIEYISIRHDITQLLELSSKLEKINTYNSKQEHLAKEKLEAGIINDMGNKECSVIHIASDILSGDIYSIYKMKNKATFLYLIDGQGHGVSPALTVFAISSMLNQFVYDVNSLDELIHRLYTNAKTFLGEIEQLSYTMIMISPDKKSITYSSGGMYPFLIKKANEIIKIKANNGVFMNFSPIPICTTIDIAGWESVLLYSDGLLEHENEALKECMPNEIINNPSGIKDSMKKISQHKFEDDVTIIYLENKS